MDGYCMQHRAMLAKAHLAAQGMQKATYWDAMDALDVWRGLCWSNSNVQSSRLHDL